MSLKLGFTGDIPPRNKWSDFGTLLITGDFGAHLEGDAKR